MRERNRGVRGISPGLVVTQTGDVLGGEGVVTYQQVDVLPVAGCDQCLRRLGNRVVRARVESTSEEVFLCPDCAAAHGLTALEKFEVAVPSRWGR